MKKVFLLLTFILLSRTFAQEQINGNIQITGLNQLEYDEIIVEIVKVHRTPNFDKPELSQLNDVYESISFTSLDRFGNFTLSFGNSVYPDAYMFFFYCDRDHFEKHPYTYQRRKESLLWLNYFPKEFLHKDGIYYVTPQKNQTSKKISDSTGQRYKKICTNII